MAEMSPLRRRMIEDNRQAFQAYVEQLLVRELKPGDIVIMDNLSSHKGPAIRQAIVAVGASLLFLPPYSPDFNQIETPSPSSRPCSEQLPSEPSRPCGPP